MGLKRLQHCAKHTTLGSESILSKVPTDCDDGNIRIGIGDAKTIERRISCRCVM